MSSARKQLEPIMERVRAIFIDKHGAREQALPLCREALRHSANAVRATHRQEYDQAQELIDRARALLDQAKQALHDHQDIYFAGFVHDAQKEYVEACATLALVAGRPLPQPESLNVELPAYLNGLGEAVGELRRHLLDRLRANDVTHCEETLAAMEDIHAELVTFDYPDAMTGGLRRTADAMRAVLERTRGDLTVSVRQYELERRLSEFDGKLS
jgi:translin